MKIEEFFFEGKTGFGDGGATGLINGYLVGVELARLDGIIAGKRGELVGLLVVGVDITFDGGIGALVVIKKMAVELVKSITAFEIFGNGVAMHKLAKFFPIFPGDPAK